MTKFSRMRPRSGGRKTKPETRGQYLKRFTEEAKRHLSEGRPSSDPRHEIEDYAGMNRKDRRGIVFGAAVATRSGGEGKYTKAPRGTRRKRRRSANAMARISRRRNRRA
jgi:hypothetical protein